VDALVIFDNPPAPPGHGIEIAKAVVIATLSALTGGLVQWWLEEVKLKRREREVECEHPRADQVLLNTVAGEEVQEDRLTIYCRCCGATKYAEKWTPPKRRT
jgi:hypothetical protein